jgi:hypothetical protein
MIGLVAVVFGAVEIRRQRKLAYAYRARAKESRHNNLTNFLLCLRSRPKTNPCT